MKLADRITLVENVQKEQGVEIASLRKSRHDANSTLHTHNGKFQVLERQQDSVLGELILIRSDLKEYIKVVNKLVNWKSFVVGAAMVVIPTVSACFIVFNWLLEYWGR